MYLCIFLEKLCFFCLPTTATKLSLSKLPCRVAARASHKHIFFIPIPRLRRSSLIVALSHFANHIFFRLSQFFSRRVFIARPWPRGSAHPSLSIQSRLSLGRFSRLRAKPPTTIARCSPFPSHPSHPFFLLSFFSQPQDKNKDHA